MTNFLHAGDLGDIIYSLPTLKKLGGGTLYIDCDGGRSDSYVQEQCYPYQRTKMTVSGYAALKPLLLQQEYIDAVEMWIPEEHPIDVNLNKFREVVLKEPGLNLAEAHARAFSVELSLDLPWLRIPESDRTHDKPYVVSRSVRNHNSFNWWFCSLHRFHDQALFVGLQKEHDIFEYTFQEPVEYHPTRDFHELAEVIRDCDTFIGNQSAPMAVAIGLGKPFMMEVYKQAPNVLFHCRENGKYF